MQESVQHNPRQLNPANGSRINYTGITELQVVKDGRKVTTAKDVQHPVSGLPVHQSTNRRRHCPLLGTLGQGKTWRVETTYFLRVQLRVQ
jgi:hypothetical protein